MSFLTLDAEGLSGASASELAFLRTPSPSRWRRALAGAGATVIGSTAVIVWALWPAMAVRTAHVPPFALLAVAYGSAFVFLVGLRCARRQTAFGMFRASWRIHLITLLGILISNVLYLFALRTVPAANANIVSYTWPLMIVVGGALLRWVEPNGRQWFGLLIGFGGAMVVIGPAWHGDIAISGYLLALGSGLAWAVYSLARMRLVGGPPDVFAAACAFAVPCCVGLHLLLEPAADPTWREYLIAALIGGGPVGGANVLWDYGITRGDAKALAVFAYATPVFASFFLILTGDAVLTFPMVVGAGMVVVGALLGRHATTKQKEVG